MIDNQANESVTYQDSSSPPNHRLLSSSLITTLAVSAALMLLTVLGMGATTNTILADWFLVLFNIPFIGVVVFGILLTAGRYIGFKGIKQNKLPLAILGTVLSVGAYSWFGGGVLSMYNSDIHILALLITSIVTIFITLLAAAYVYTTSKNLSHFETYSGYAFLAGLAAVFIGSFITPVLLLGFVLFFIGFLLDLVYEIWEVSVGGRSPVLNGFGVYIAFAGVFVHVLQIVLRILAEQ